MYIYILTIGDIHRLSKAIPKPFYAHPLTHFNSLILEINYELIMCTCFPPFFEITKEGEG